LSDSAGAGSSYPAAGRSPRLDRALWGLSAVVVLGAIMSILDTTIVNVAIETLARDLDASLSTIQWVTTGYLLALSMVIPITGWAGQRFGVKRMWMASVGLFVGGSALCGAAWSAHSLIAFRVLQGVGGGMVMPLGQTILAQAAGPERMGRVMSVLGVPMMLGPVFGPVIGGLIVDSVSWRWIFYVNVPIGLVALALAYRVLARDEPKGGERLDVLGLALLSPGLALLVYGLSEAGSHGTVTNPSSAIGVLAGGALVAAFVLHALRTRAEALLDVRLFADHHFSAAAGTVFLFGVSLFGAMLLLPLYYQVVRDESALTAGLLLAPQGLGAAAAMPVAGRLTDRLGAGRVVPLGLLLALAGTVAYTQVGSDTSYALLAGSLVVRGLGLGATMMPSMAAAYQTLRRDQVPRAAPTLNIIMRVGGSLGTALLAVVLARFISSNIPGATGSLSTATSGARHAGAAAPLADAFASTFWLAFALTAVAVLPALLLPRRPVAPAAPATARAASP
jgi:EmrB/QacA subfamily drug resistance transporter